MDIVCKYLYEEMWSGVKIKNFRGKGVNFVSKSYQESGAKGAVQVGVTIRCLPLCVRCSNLSTTAYTLKASSLALQK